MGNLVGRSLAHFRIEAELGEGGMGVVYRATDEKLRRHVALKVLPESFSMDEDRRRRFLREARSAAAITHANIAAVYEADEADGHVYIAMELVDGETLRTRIDSGIDIPEGVRIAKEIARGLGRAHEKGIAHRDLKPENVMITRHDEVKILDFGLAKLWDESAGNPSALGNAKTEEQHLTREGGILGTPAYMSPEQAQGEPVDARTDIFSFGVLLFEMLTGERPFGGTTAIAMMLAASHDPPKRASDINPLVSPELDRIVEQCLEKKPEGRYANGEQLVKALTVVLPEPRVSEALSGRIPPSTPTASPVTPGPSTVAPTGKSLLRWGLVAVAGLGAAGIGLAYRARATASTTTDRAATSGSVATPAPAVTRVVDLPPPRTSVPAAATEYASGLQAMHDDNWDKASAHFKKAVELDSSMAAAHLRLSMASVGDPATRRSEFEKAAGLRAQLGSRDQALMEALQPYLQNASQDTAETKKRLRALAKTYPTDVEIWMWLGGVDYGVPEGLAPASHALELDPGDGQSWENKGMALLAQGKVDEARAAFEQCGKISVDGADCFVYMGFADSAAGRCADAEKDERQAADRSPPYLRGVLAAMTSTGARGEALEETLRQLLAIPEYTGPDRAIFEATFEAQLAIIAGDFTLASGRTKTEARALAADPILGSSYRFHYQLTSQQLDIALETADDAGARRIANEFVVRSGAWQNVATGHGVDLSLYFARLTLPWTDAPDADFETKRRAWVDARLAAGAYRGQVWSYAYAAPALNASEARSALDALAELGPPAVVPLGSVSGRIGSPEADLGRVYLLAGRLDEAVDHLRRAVAACNQFDSTLDHVRAALNLGRALELKGDPRGACEAYGKVLAQWGNAKPRSVTADEARKRVNALACAH